MQVKVKAAYFDQRLKRQLNPGDTVEMAKERVSEVCGAFPGILDEVKAKRTARKKAE